MSCKRATRSMSPATRPGFRAGQKPANAGRRLPVEILTPDEVRSLIRACSNRAPSGIRNRALLTVLYRGGLRVSEALALYPKDVDPVNGTVTVLHGKGDRRRGVGLDPEAFAIVSRWLDKRRELGLNGRQRLFSTLAGRPLHSSYVRQLLPRLAARAGIEKRVHPHGLRHTHAAELAAERFPTNVIQTQLGHSNLSTTDRYLKHIAPTEVIEAMKSRRWSLDPLVEGSTQDRELRRTR